MTNKKIIELRNQEIENICNIFSVLIPQNFVCTISHKAVVDEDEDPWGEIWGVDPIETFDEVEDLREYLSGEIPGDAHIFIHREGTHCGGFTYTLGWMCEVEEENRKGPIDNIESVGIVLNGKKLMLDLSNLRDRNRAYQNVRYTTKEREHYFDFYAAQEAAKVVKKRLMTEEEQNCMAKLSSRWDADLKGRWFTFETIDGKDLDVFFPAAGYRGTDGTQYNVGQYGYYWSSSSSSDRYGLSLHLNTGTPGVSDFNHGGGLAVRCVRDISE